MRVVIRLCPRGRAPWRFLSGALVAGAVGSLCPVSVVAQELSPEDVVGCYDVRFEPPPVPPFTRGDSVRYMPPPRVFLEPSGEITTPDGSVPSANGRARWTARSSTLAMYWLGPTEGLTAEVAPVAGGFSGTAEPVAAEGSFPAQARAALVAVRSDCDEPSPFPREGLRRFVRSVESEDGAVIELGAEPPDVAFLPTLARMRGDKPAVALAVTGPLSGNDSIGVDGDPSGRVASIVLHYPSWVPVTLLRDRIAAAYGPWHEDGPPGDFAWEGRMETMVLSGGEGRRSTLRLSDPRTR